MYCYIDRLKWSFLPGLDTYELHWFQNETIVNLRECTDSLIRNYVPGFTYLALNPSFYFGEQPYTIQTIMMITWKAQWDIEYVETCSTVYHIVHGSCRVAMIHISQY